MNPLGGHKMAQMPVKKLLLNMGTPMMISMLGQALYNVVDTFFVSHIPDTAAVADMGDKAINAFCVQAVAPRFCLPLEIERTP